MIQHVTSVMETSAAIATAVSIERHFVHLYATTTHKIIPFRGSQESIKRCRKSGRVRI
jgi:hypothetical protein